MPAWLQWLLACLGSAYAGMLLVAVIMSSGRDCRRGGYMTPPSTSPAPLTRTRTAPAAGRPASDPYAGLRAMYGDNDWWLRPALCGRGCQLLYGHDGPHEAIMEAIPASPEPPCVGCEEAT